LFLRQLTLARLSALVPRQPSVALLLALLFAARSGARFDIFGSLNAARFRHFGARFDIVGFSMLLAPVASVLTLIFLGVEMLLASVALVLV
jgi:hypothetical protein